MERVERGDDLASPPGLLRTVTPRQLDGRFVGLGAAVAEEHPVGEGMVAEHLGQPGLGLDVIEVRDVDQGPHLLRYRLGHGRVAVAETVDGDAGDEVQILLAVRVPHPYPFPLTSAMGKRA